MAIYLAKDFVAEYIRARYARWNGLGLPVDIVTTCLPMDPGPGRILVAVDLAAASRSDLQAVSGCCEAAHPGILGHEQVGHVVSIGVDAAAFDANGVPISVGDRVVWSVTAACGRCSNCLRGLEQKCLHLRRYGHETLEAGWSLNGGFASHCVLLPGTTIVAVPTDLPDTVAAPASGATATVVAALESAELRRYHSPVRVLITGAGMLGVTAAAMADAAGAWVAVCDPDPDRRDLARSFGADMVSADASDVPPVDVALEMSGNPLAVEACIGSLDVGGRAVLVGSMATGRTIWIDPELIVRNMITLIGVYNYRPGHLKAAVDFLAAAHHRYPFAELVESAGGLDHVEDVLFGEPGAGRLRRAVRPGW